MGEKRVKFSLGRQEIDAFGRYGDLYVIVDAKTRSSIRKKAREMQKAIRIIEGYKEDVVKDIKNIYGKKHGFRKAIFVLWTKRIPLKKHHIQIAREKGIALRDSFDLKYYNACMH